MDDRFNWGHELYRVRRFAEAIEVLSEVLAKDPDHEQAISCVAECHRYLRDHAGAEAFLSRLVHLNPESPWPWFRRGRARMAQEKYELAIEDLTRAELQEPDGVYDQGLYELFLVRADCFEAIDKLEMAIADFQMYGYTSGKRYVGDREVARLRKLIDDRS